MQRRLFLKGILAVPAVPTVVLGSQLSHPQEPQQNAQRSIELLATSVAGYRYYAGAANFKRMRVGDALTLRREPENAFDTLAIAVFWQDQKIGYIPRRHNRAPQNLMDQNIKVRAVIKEKLTRDYEPLRLQLYFDAVGAG